MNRILVFLFLSIGIVSYSQSSEKYNSKYENFYRAEELFSKMQFGAARKEFRNFIDSYDQPTDPMYVKALYYEGISALELFNNDAVTLLENFNRNYPESIYKMDIYFRLGKYYYQKKKYDDALEWFNKLSIADVEPENQDEFYFKVGYANFQEENFTEARNAFYEVKDGVSQYANPSLYYYSHIAYKEGAYQTALDGFLKLENDEQFGSVVPYYIAQIYYLQGNYEAVTQYAPLIDGGKSKVNETDMNHLIGDAYYRIGKYDESVPYLEAYDKAANTTRDEDYQLGYAFYKSKAYDKAIKLFDRVTRTEDSLGQVALYHIGECYMELKNYQSARSAFQSASEIEANEKIEEDALYQAAILSYKLDINPYNEAIVSFERYLEKYPNSERRNDVYQYLVNVYTSTNNYGKALSSLDKLPNKDIKLKKAYQLIAYNYGIEKYQKTNYSEAITTLALVDKYPIDPTLSGKAKFWSADASFIMENYNAAISGYRTFISAPGNTLTTLKDNAQYNIGYAYLNLGDTVMAIEAFRTFTQSTTADKLKKADAFMRVADGYYMGKNNDLAIKYYKEALNLNVAYQDQALYYMATTYGIKGEQGVKITHLSNIVNNYTKSKYLQPALYDIGHSYKLRQEYSSALNYFNQLLKDYPNSSLVKDARIDIADIYLKRKEYTKAEQEYKLILSLYGSDNEYCSAAARGLKDVYAATNQIAKIEQLADQYACANISIYELENVLFEPALALYDAKNYAEAIPKFKTYLNKYPTGVYSVEANAFLANSHYELNQMNEAILVYKECLLQPNNSFTELAASRVAKYYYNNQEYVEAIPYYERLESVSSDPEIVFNAQLGLMRCNFLTEDFEAAAAYAQSVLNHNLMSGTYRLESEYAFGMSSYNLIRLDAALPALTYVSKNTPTEIASESKFCIADIYFQQNKLDQSDATIRALLKMKPSYDYWIAKGLILQSRILILKDDLFQAEQTLKSVIDNYPIQDDGIITEANQLYDELMQLKNQPKSNLVPEGTTIIELNEGGN